MSGFGAFARYRRHPVGEHERCELCGALVGSAHPHVADLLAQALRCACPACAILFRDPAAGGDRYRTVPDRVRTLPEGALDEGAWDGLDVPVGLAFFFYRSSLGRWVACYPSPAGPTESDLPGGSWERFAPGGLLEAAEPDVEAVLVRRGRDGESDCLLVPIDACYELVAVVRQRWEGFDGGDAARGAVDGFFARLRERAKPLSPPRGGGA